MCKGFTNLVPKNAYDKVCALAKAVWGKVCACASSPTTPTSSSSSPLRRMRVSALDRHTQPDHSPPTNAIMDHQSNWCQLYLYRQHFYCNSFLQLITNYYNAFFMPSLVQPERQQFTSSEVVPFSKRFYLQNKWMPNFKKNFWKIQLLLC